MDERRECGLGEKGEVSYQKKYEGRMWEQALEIFKNPGGLHGVRCGLVRKKKLAVVGGKKYKS